ncbi:nuclear pore complex protein NUP98A isoform X2 [Ananas comosus]|uniref:Nucleoporin autopeptidase n=1 Tax=Ananas comosus TaxID=4615 RepID=A0A6P5FZE4_ANACO|nr:nuclear pore complex protein NUP98A isoform X2 [Ananas comosus]
MSSVLPALLAQANLHLVLQVPLLPQPSVLQPQPLVRQLPQDSVPQLLHLVRQPPQHLDPRQLRYSAVQEQDSGSQVHQHLVQHQLLVLQVLLFLGLQLLLHLVHLVLQHLVLQVFLLLERRALLLSVLDPLPPLANQHPLLAAVPLDRHHHLSVLRAPHLNPWRASCCSLSRSSKFEPLLFESLKLISAFLPLEKSFIFCETPGDCLLVSRSCSVGAQSTTPTFGSPGFGQPTFGGQAGGSRIAPYTPTPEVDGGTGTQPAGKLESISAMPVYKDKSHEELRWEDYQRGDKGGPNPSGQPASGISFPAPTQSSPFGATGTFGQTAANPFSSTTSSNPFALKTPAFGSTGFGSSSTSLFSSPFSSSSTSSPFGATSSTTPSLFGAPTGSAFGPSSSSSPFGGTTTPAFGSSSSPSIFGSSMAGSTSSFGSGLTFGNTQSSGLFQSSTPAFGQTPSPFGQTSTGFQQSSPAFGSNLFSTPSTGFGGSLFSSSTPSLFPSSTPSGFGQTAPSLSTPFPAPLPAQTSSGFSFGNFGQTPPALSGGFGGSPNLFSQSTFGQSTASQSNMVMQPAPITNPFGTLPAMPQMSIGLAGSTPSVQYGISSMPVSEKPPPVRTFSMLVPRHLSQRRIRLPPRRYNLKPDGPKVPFYADEEEAPSTPKADAFFIPRENPRALIIRPIEQWPLRNGAEKQTISRDEATPEKQNGKVAGEPSAPPASEPLEEDHDDYHPERRHTPDNNAATPSPSRPAQKANGIHDGDHTPPKGFQAAIAYEHGADIEALMPKLRHADGYYTEPRVQELAAKERAEPGFCRRVKDFVVGRRGYGSIKFYGETDIRALDLELIVQFNNREVIVYKDENRKPPVGQGLNKPAEVTLLNIKCVNKKTGQQYTEGPRVEKYKEMLMKKAEEQGAEFVSYDAVKGEWKFRVKHFSIYEFGEGDYSDFAES